ncbi:receptor-like serine/threonine-protein kinase ALE2 isoform X2 [Dendrobium catenatum]|uniref:receptor-like serine/threonine-protein kinase ALE2 isoform X2 n=1 Tax=Dendrobium catenatum TaxID=906689 RepID=UPI00109FF3BA|nr:receptor-like serine/threonine-protein kinase ALE2 isoform X2 [Dendrobium catenatum]
MLTPKHKRSYAPSPYIGGAMINLAPSPSPVEISNNKTKNYASPPYVEGPKISTAPLHPPIETSKRNRRHHAPSPSPQGPNAPPIQAPTSSNSEISAAPLPSSASPTSYITWQIHPPKASPSATFGGKSSSPPLQPKRSLPPPPPNSDCGPVVCQSPFTNPCPGSPCKCVLPIKVGLRLGVALYIFFPLVSEFAKEIATGVSMKRSHVRIMGANSAIEDPEKTDVLIDLVPLGKSFDNTTVFITFEKFWKNQVSIQASYFGDYVVLYVSYPGVPMNVRIGPSSTSASLSSSMSTYNGSAKTFTLADMERTTNRFDDSRVIGEGGFGRVYQGTLEDGTMVAVKVLKRVDRQGEREFLAEVEMLSRLHHRNLVKLIGICTDENVRCLVYELIPNGSVESHLHGVDKETAPLDWNARVKIALGAARGLAYLHEDSSPCVIHRDFKSSNILLEHDFTPRVSDFGLARSALDEGKEHISTRVMGTFGYVDPEYAMTGHLLVKSDVYSYGVVLLELLTGRKPIDMSQPPGHENLVAWTRSLLTNIEGLQAIIDPVLGANYPQNSVAKVLAIASMCVQPEVSHRPLMSEVVQALKLVYNESDEYRQSVSYSQDEMSVRDVESGISVELCHGTARERNELDVFGPSSSFAGDASGSFRRYSSSGPLRTGGSRLFWQRVGGLGSGSSSEHGFVRGFWLRRHRWSQE